MQSIMNLLVQIGPGKECLQIWEENKAKAEIV